jgi:hypothetical protein
MDKQKNLQAVENEGTQTTVTPEVNVDSGITGAMGGTNTSQIVEQEPTVTAPPVRERQAQAPTEGTDLNLGGNNYYAQVAPLTSSWENQAAQQQGIKFQQDVLAGKQTLLRGAQEAQAKGQEMQTQLALGEYMRGQSQEKAGWTGGYMLDQKRQGDYLKASIQAQMYGQQELQRYGMETQLEAARLAYDLGKDQLAYQLYQQEYQRSLQEAQMFGYYVSPENRDMLNQYRAANSVLADANATEEEKARATVIKTQINEWFGEEDIDPNDLQAFSQITMEREQWNQAKIDAVLATINDDPSTFIARNPDGTYSTDPATGQYIKLNFDDINSADLATFLSRDDGSENKFADATFRSYAKFLAQSSINDYFTSLGEDGVPTVDGLKAYLAGLGADRLQAFRDKNPSLKATIDAILADNFSPSLSRNGVTITYGRYETTSPTSTTTDTTNTPLEPAVVDEDNPDAIYTSYKNPYNNTVVTRDEFVERFRKYSVFISGGSSFTLPTNSTEYAEQYRILYNNSIDNYSFSKEIPESVNYVDWAKNLHNSHNIFIGGDYDKHLEERISSHIKEKAGFDLGAITFIDTPYGPNASTIQLDSFNLTNPQKEKLKTLGFSVSVINGKEIISIGFKKPESIKPLPGSQKITNWNSSYGGWGNSRQDKEYWLFTLLKKPATDNTNTTEGEGRF